MSYETLIVEVSEQVALIRLNRPKALNALNSQLLGELAQALRAADKDEAVRCIVLTGSEKAFAAGADISEMAPKSFVEMFESDFFTPETEVLLATRKPVIAAVAGYALGGGCELAMMCDFIIAADNARFGQPEIKLGIIPGFGGTQRLPRAIGKARAMDMILTGRMVTAEEAEKYGLVARVVPADKLLDEALDAATTIASMSLPSVMMAKECINRAYEMPLDEGLLNERRNFHSLFSTHDQKEGMSAFLEKRSPDFRHE